MKVNERKIYRTSKKDQAKLAEILEMVRAKKKAEAEEKALQEILSESN